MDDYFSLVDSTATRVALNTQGFARIPEFLSPEICRNFIQGYSQNLLYRSTINMQRFNFGSGQYRYFKYPLEERLTSLRRQSYEFLRPVAKQWAADLKQNFQFPERYQDYLDCCHQAGQVRPTPLILRYQQGDYNCLHQDLYGDLVFPLQLIVMLSDPAADFTGGELVLTEQRPRMQSRAHVLNLAHGEAVIIAVNHRPAAGTRGYYRVVMKHGVGEIHGGTRHTLGIILHDAT
tara:strand:+ start:3889 stop:4590 length:702 start_codon:yes stop_codon:yes gene_type:complete